MRAMIDLVATCPRGTEAVLLGELSALGAVEPRCERGAVVFRGDPELAYRTCLWSRVASRILQPVLRFDADDDDELYAAVRDYPWEEHLRPSSTFAVDCVAAKERSVHTRFWTLRTKDAIVDRLRERTGSRPSVALDDPDLRLHVHIGVAEVSVALDLSGRGLHRRGYRPKGAEAPLKENLAAAFLLMADWPERAARGEPLVDPMCGSGTLVVEAAMIASDRAPGLRRHAGFQRWLTFDEPLWRRLLDEANERYEVGRGSQARVFGFDASNRALELAAQSCRSAGISATLSRAAIGQSAGWQSLEAHTAGLVVTNPPYGVRLGDPTALPLLYRSLGDALKRSFGGWNAFVLAGVEAPIQAMGLKPRRRIVLYNGKIECRLLDLPIRRMAAAESEEGAPTEASPRKRSPEAEAFDNRLRKNLRRVGGWARRHGHTAYRLYDAEIPEINITVDIYGEVAQIQEHEPPAHIKPALAQRRLLDAIDIVRDRLDLSEERLFVKVRRRQRERAQYERLEDEREPFEIVEGGHRLIVNLADHLDTGLFLDHRSLRAELAKHAPGRRFLNLFAYTCSATVYAAAAGARGSLSVDLSPGYLRWGERNFALNGLDRKAHRTQQADVMEFLRGHRERYGLIFLAPPTFSRSKRASADFDIARDQVELLSAALERLEPGGRLYFSTHARRFELDPSLAPSQRRGISVEEITSRSVPFDFRRSPHRAWLFERQS